MQKHQKSALAGLLVCIFYTAAKIINVGVLNISLAKAERGKACQRGKSGDISDGSPIN